MTKKEVSVSGESLHDDAENGTVIAQGVCLEGNMTTTGQVYVFGEVKGNIHACDGQINIMRDGLVTGNITSPVLIVDGNVRGECCAERVEICEHGRVEGKLRYTTLSVVQGGVLAGQAEHCKDTQSDNVVDFAHEQDDESATAAR